MTKVEYEALAPDEQGYASYMQAAWNKEIPDKCPYPPASQQAVQWNRGNYRAMMAVSRRRRRMNGSYVLASGCVGGVSKDGFVSQPTHPCDCCGKGIPTGIFSQKVCWECLNAGQLWAAKQAFKERQALQDNGHVGRVLDYGANVQCAGNGCKSSMECINQASLEGALRVHGWAFVNDSRGFVAWPNCYAKQQVSRINQPSEGSTGKLDELEFFKQGPPSQGIPDASKLPRGGFF